MSDQAQGPGWWQASDGKWYPPQPPEPQPPPPPPPPPSFSGPPPPQPSYQPSYQQPAAPAKQGAGCLKIGLIVLGVLTLIGIVLTVVFVFAFGEAVDDAADEFDERQEEALDDVEVVSCRLDDLGFMEAELRITNNSSDRSNYTIDVTFEAPNGDQIDTGFSAVSALESGQSTTETASSFTEPNGEFECRVVDVFRISDE